MTYDPERHHRRSIRLKGYDYAQAGAYFVTICTQDRACLFGDVVDGKMRLNDAGRMVAESWQWLAMQYDYIQLDESVIMPNHMHGIIVVTDGGGRGGSRTAPTIRTAPTMRTAPTVNRKPVGRIIGAFKTVSTKRINEMRGLSGSPIWQRNYYEHIIRNEESLNRIREYIANNAAQWALDRENPNVAGAIREPPQPKDKPCRCV